MSFCSCSGLLVIITISSGNLRWFSYSLIFQYSLIYLYVDVKTLGYISSPCLTPLVVESHFFILVSAALYIWSRFPHIFFKISFSVIALRYMEMNSFSKEMKANSRGISYSLVLLINLLMPVCDKR